MAQQNTGQADAGFVHLHVHSSFSLLEGALTIGKLAELAKKDRQPAIALTDTGNLFGALEFSEKMAGSGIQPILGCSLAVDFPGQPNAARPRRPAAPAHRPSGDERGGLEEPDGAGLPLLPRHRVRRRAAPQARLAARP